MDGCRALYLDSYLSASLPLAVSHKPLLDHVGRRRGVTGATLDSHGMYNNCLANIAFTVSLLSNRMTRQGIATISPDFDQVLIDR